VNKSKKRKKRKNEEGLSRDAKESNIYIKSEKNQITKNRKLGTNFMWIKLKRKYKTYEERKQKTEKMKE
jgi:hypothetical protein